MPTVLKLTLISGKYYLEFRRFEEAKTYYKEAIRVKPNSHITSL